jgi:hypothetical protein
MYSLPKCLCRDGLESPAFSDKKFESAMESKEAVLGKLVFIIF